MGGKRRITIALAFLMLITVIASGAMAGFEHQEIVETDVPLEETDIPNRDEVVEDEFQESISSEPLEIDLDVSLVKGGQSSFEPLDVDFPTIRQRPIEINSIFNLTSPHEKLKRLRFVAVGDLHETKRNLQHR